MNVSRDGLFAIKLDEELTGPLSQCRLYLHPGFLHAARRRAKRHIDADRNKFDVSPY